MELQGKTAIITGGASGLGEATVRHFVSLGAKCAIFDINEERANSIIADVGAENAVFFPVGVTKTETIEAAIAGTMEAYGAIHICCNYAGIGSAEKRLKKTVPPILMPSSRSLTSIWSVRLMCCVWPRLKWPKTNR